ncbi:MAG: histidine kinase [Saprospiraceae bacterium]
MQGWLKKITDYLTSSTLWMYLTLFLFISYLLQLSVTTNSWTAYLSNFLALCLLFFPVLIYSGWRSWLTKWEATIGRLIVWGYCFIAHPILLYTFRNEMPQDFFFFSKIDLSVGTIDNFFLTIGGIVLLTEIVVLGSNQIQKGLFQAKWFETIGLEKTILLFLFFLALIASTLGVILEVRANFSWGFTNVTLLILTFIANTMQVFLIYLGYYFFYYVNHYLLIPKVFKQKGAIYYGFAVAAMILVFYPIFVSLVHFLPVVRQLDFNRFTATPNIFAEDKGGLPFVIMVLSVPVIIAYEWFKQHNELAQLEKEKSATELNLLKQQINPHFFFNTLNNLYALSITQDKQTPEVIMQLSELMRYVIYKGKEEEVKLSEEIKYIEDYIQLQQIRLHKKLDFRFEKDIADDQIKVPPLLFIVLVENAFKHGIEVAERPCFLHLHLKVTETALRFSCTNSLEDQSATEGGIGLANLQRRLELRYPGEHQLQVEALADRYSALLTIDLKQSI